MESICRLWRDDLAQDTSEYALLLLLIAAALVTAVTVLSGQIQAVLGSVTGTLAPK
jgi:Flp pilus assembly pilin Flp